MIISKAVQTYLTVCIFMGFANMDFHHWLKLQIKNKRETSWYRWWSSRFLDVIIRPSHQFDLF